MLLMRILNLVSILQLHKMVVIVSWLSENIHTVFHYWIFFYCLDEDQGRVFILQLNTEGSVVEFWTIQSGVDGLPAFDVNSAFGRSLLFVDMGPENFCLIVGSPSFNREGIH